MFRYSYVNVMKSKRIINFKKYKNNKKNILSSSTIHVQLKKKDYLY